MKNKKYELGSVFIRLDSCYAYGFTPLQYAVIDATRDINKGFYDPTIQELADDIGVSRITAIRAIKLSRKFGFTEAKGIKPTKQGLAFLRKKGTGKGKFSYFVVDIAHRQYLNLTLTEYLVADCYGNLKKYEWVWLNKKTVANRCGITEQWLNSVIDSLVEKGIVETRMRKMEHSNLETKDVKMKVNWFEQNKKKVSKR